MPHVVLLGDSIFDNRAYTGAEPDVVTHLRAILPRGWTVTLAAVDGATTAGVRAQMSAVPPDASHLVLSVGGNDALANLDLLSTPVTSTAEALTLFARRRDAFEAAYRGALAAVLGRSLPATVCTIYNGNLPEPQAPLARVALTIFNDVILRAAFDHGCGVIELRLVCSEPRDYANPIEPSGRGGSKIARAVARAAGALDPERTSTVIAAGL